MLHCRCCLTPLSFPWLSPCTSCLAQPPSENPGEDPVQNSGSILVGTSYRVFKNWKTRPNPRLDHWAKTQVMRPKNLHWIRNHADYLHPIPQDPARSRSLGHWPAGKLAHWIKNVTGIPILNLLLPHPSRPQGSRTYQERLDTQLIFEPAPNANDMLRSVHTDSKILLIDDLRTSGSTLRSAQESLEFLGLNQIYCWTLGLRPAPLKDCKRAGPTPYPSVTNSMP